MSDLANISPGRIVRYPIGGLSAAQSALQAQQQMYLGQLELAQMQAMANTNPYANAYKPPAETLEGWFERLERRVNRLLDDGEFMSELEHMRWTAELEKWRETTEPNPLSERSASMHDAG